MVSYAILGLNQGHQLLEEKFGVAIGATAPELGRFGGRVFVNAGFAGVVNADDDQWLDQPLMDGVVGGFFDVPVVAGNESRRSVEEILAVVKVQDGIAAVRPFLISRWQIDDEVALV